MFWLAAALVLAAVLVQRRNVSRTSDKPPAVPPAKPPGVPKSDGECLLWMHKTPAGFECVGYCDHVKAGPGSIKLTDARILDLTADPHLSEEQEKPRGITIQPTLFIPTNNLKRLSLQPMGGLVLYHLTNAGILDDGAGRIMFPGRNAWDGAQICATVKQVLIARHKAGAKMSFWTWLATLPAAIVDVVSSLITGGEVSLIDFFGRKLAAGNFTTVRKSANLYQVSGSQWATYWRAASPYPVIVEISPAGVYYAAEVGDR